VLIAPDFSKEFKLEVDASDVGVGAVLLQNGNDKMHLPICYFSKKKKKKKKKKKTGKKKKKKKKNTNTEN